MVMEEQHLNKLLYKLELYCIKIIPMLIAGLYLSNTILSYFGIDLIIFSILGGMSVLTILFLYLSSYVFRFCAYHRMFIHYILITDVINYIDYYFEPPLEDRYLFAIHIAITGIILFIILYLKLHERKLNKTIRDCAGRCSSESEKWNL